MLCFCGWQPLAAQEANPAVDSVILVKQDSNRVSFTASLPPLTQIPGAPAPFYTYLWDFGDGHFSTAENPLHYYDRLSGFDVYMYAVNNYDDGKKPQRRKIKVNVGKTPTNVASVSQAERDFFKANGIFELKYNCMAKPDDTMVLIAGWKNPEMQNNGGKLYLLLNEKIYEQTCFDTSAFRFYNNDSLAGNRMMATLSPQSTLTVTESGSPASNTKQLIGNYYSEAQSLLVKTFSVYKNMYEIDLGEMAPNATQFSFTELYVTPEMIRDTNATLTVTGVYVPKKGNPVMHRVNIPVVNSHDPNKMNLKGGRLFYRFIKKHQPLTYKVRFQNTGKGPARKVALDIALPPSLDPQSISIKDMYPYCPPCDSLPEKRGCWELEKNEGGAVFTFNGIYLPGTDQKGVEDKDSTKGFMEFGIVSKKRLENKPFKARTAIYFDKNEPIITNYATGRFHKGISPVVMAGFEAAFGSGKVSNGIVTGIGLAPIAPRLPYLQFELFYKQGLASTTTNITNIERPGMIFIDSMKREFSYKNFDSSETNSISQVKLIPAQLRYNINKYVSIGAGAIVTADVGGYSETKNTYHLSGFNQQAIAPYAIALKEQIKSFSNIQARPFFDVQLGLVKWGPHLGARYYYNGRQNSYGFFYAGIRF